MQGPLVSILIPAYNARKTIVLAIDSCLRQGYPHIEILVVDDASTDATVDEIKKFKNITLLQHDKRLGTPAARNALLKAATGEYIAWLDADDSMLPHRIERQVLFMKENPEVDIAGSWILTDSNKIPKRKLPTGNEMITAYLWFKNCMVQPGIISRNFYVRENIFYNTSFYYMQDYELWYRLRNKKVFANIPEYLTHYHVSLPKEIEQKHATYHTLQPPDQLWKLKWADGDFDLDESQKKSLQNFLGNAGRVSTFEVKVLKSIFNKMDKDVIFLQKYENRLMIHLYRLIIFRRLDFKDKLLNPGLLISLAKYGSLKKMHLIQ